MFPRKALVLLYIFLLCAVPLLAQAASTPHWVHYRLLEKKPPLPKKLLVLPVNVEVLEMSAGDVQEEVPEWSEEADRIMGEAVRGSLANVEGVKQVGLPKLSNKSAAVVDEHMALYKLVVNTASRIGWEHKTRHWDYSIGPGLKELRRLSGADAALMVYGRDVVSTAGRKTKAVLARIPIVNIFTGAPPKLGHSFVHIGLVDLRTGDLLWMNSRYREGSSNLRDPDDARAIVDWIFRWYPGIEKYRKVYVR